MLLCLAALWNWAIEANRTQLHLPVLYVFYFLIALQTFIQGPLRVRSLGRISFVARPLYDNNTWMHCVGWRMSKLGESISGWESSVFNFFLHGSCSLVACSTILLCLWCSAPVIMIESESTTLHYHSWLRLDSYHLLPGLSTLFSTVFKLTIYFERPHGHEQSLLFLLFSSASRLCQLVWSTLWKLERLTFLIE